MVSKKYPNIYTINNIKLLISDETHIITNSTINNIYDKIIEQWYNNKNISKNTKNTILQKRKYESHYKQSIIKPRKSIKINKKGKYHLSTCQVKLQTKNRKIYTII